MSDGSVDDDAVEGVDLSGCQALQNAAAAIQEAFVEVIEPVPSPSIPKTSSMIRYSVVDFVGSQNSFVAEKAWQHVPHGGEAAWSVGHGRGRREQVARMQKALTIVCEGLLGAIDACEREPAKDEAAYTLAGPYEQDSGEEGTQATDGSLSLDWRRLRTERKQLKHEVKQLRKVLIAEDSSQQALESKMKRLYGERAAQIVTSKMTAQAGRLPEGAAATALIACLKDLAREHQDTILAGDELTEHQKAVRSALAIVMP